MMPNHLCLDLKKSERISAIVISSKVQKLKTDNPALYRFIIGHELGHYHIDSKNRNTYKRYTDSSLIDNDEMVADYIGKGLSGVSKDQVIKLFDEFTNEFKNDIEKQIRRIDITPENEMDISLLKLQTVRNSAEKRMRLISSFK